LFNLHALYYTYYTRVFPVNTYVYQWWHRVRIKI